jgi:hypothetical protein
MQNENGSSNDREFLGVTQNECTFQGKVTGDPAIHGDNFAFINLRTQVSEQAPNGQWVDTIMDIPIIAIEPNKVSIVKRYIADGRELLVYAYYKSWTQEGQAKHAFVAKKFVLGRKKYEPKPAGGNVPPLPVS